MHSNRCQLTVDIDQLALTSLILEELQAGRFLHLDHFLFLALPIPFQSNTLKFHQAAILNPIYISFLPPRCFAVIQKTNKKVI